MTLPRKGIHQSLWLLMNLLLRRQSWDTRAWTLFQNAWIRGSPSCVRPRFGLMAISHHLLTRMGQSHMDVVL